MADVARFARIAQQQYGAIAADQLDACGYSRGARSRLVANGHLELVHPRVYRTIGAPRTWEQQCMAAALAAGDGALLSHRSAAALWGLVGDRTDLVEVTVPRGRLPRLSGVIVHRYRDLGSGWTTRRRRLPVTNPLRTMVDLGAVVPAGGVEDALDLGLAGRLFSVAAVEWAYTGLARPGRRGCGVLRHVLDERALADDRPDGLLEPRMARLMRDHGLPPAVFQFEVRDERGRFIGRVDFAYPDRMLAIEVDGYATRATPRAMEHDLDRQNRLTNAGWRVLRFMWRRVVRRPGGVAADIREALAS